MSEHFPEVYADLLYRLVSNGRHVRQENARTGVGVAVLPSGCSMQFDLTGALLPTPGLRRVYPRTAAAELAWFLSGERDPTWLRRYCRIWDKFVERVGSYPGPQDLVRNAYGYRWRWHFGRDQVRQAVEALRSDPSDRRVYVSAWDPSRDGLGAPAVNVPCPVGYSVYALGDQVHLSVFMRSLDVFVGLPYDVMDFALLTQCFAAELGLWPGSLRLTAAHAHLYDCHRDMAITCLTQPPVAPDFVMPRFPVLSVRERRDEFVEAVTDISNDLSWPAYAPVPEVVK